MKKNLLILLPFMFFISCSTDKEISLLEEATRLIKDSKSVEEATLNLKNFLDKRKNQINEVVYNFNQSESEKQMEKYLEFNRKLYDKDSLFEIIDSRDYNKDENFNKVFDEFKKAFAPFFQKENKIGE